MADIEKMNGAEKTNDGISPEHRQLIEDIRRRVGHLFTEEFKTDFDILRWLQGHNYDVEVVIPKLKSHLKVLRSFDFSRSKWNPLMQEYYPFGMLGSTGKDNNFLMIDCTGRIDGEGVLRTIPLTDVLMTTIGRMQLLTMSAIRKREAMTGRQSGLILVMDAEGMSASSVTMALTAYRPFGLFLTHHYTEIFQKILLVNAASYLYYAWKLVKPFMPERTQNKVEILGSDWKKVLLGYVDGDKLPVHWGGTMVDPGGDTMCRSRVIVPVKVPTSLYWTPGPNDPPKDSLTTLTIPVGRHEFISIPVEQVGGLLKWYFFTDGDSSFGIYWTDNEDEYDTDVMEMVYPFFVIIATASKKPENSSLKCTKPGVYRFRFGNEHAWISRLKVMYKIGYEKA